MPETRNSQHPQQRQFSAAQRHRRITQSVPHCCQTKDGLSNLQSFLVNTAPCFPAGYQVTQLCKVCLEELCLTSEAFARCCYLGVLSRRCVNILFNSN